MDIEGIDTFCQRGKAGVTWDRGTGLDAYIGLRVSKSDGLVSWDSESWFGMKARSVGFHDQIEDLN